MDTEDISAFWTKEKLLPVERLKIWSQDGRQSEEDKEVDGKSREKLRSQFENIVKFLKR